MMHEIARQLSDYTITLCGFSTFVLKSYPTQPLSPPRIPEASPSSSSAARSRNSSSLGATLQCTSAEPSNEIEN